MTDSRLYYRVNAPNVVSETIDGEVIVINLANGNYYSLDSVGASIWAWIEQGAAQNEIVDWLPNAYDCNGQDVVSSVQSFVNTLETEGLILPQAINGTTAMSFPVPAKKAPFQMPTLNTFNDMQDLLLLDPIHDVDETGWPQQRSDLHD